MGNYDPTRRRFVQAVGIGGIAGLAGCLGDDEDDDLDPEDDDDDVAPPDDDDDDDDDEPTIDHPWYGPKEDAPDEVDTRFIHPVWDVPADVHFNPYNETMHVGDGAELYWEEFAKYHTQDDRFEPRAIQDWDIADDQMTLEVWTDLQWHDGEPFTAEDVRAHLLLQILHWSATLGDFIEDPIKDIEVVDEGTVQITTDEPINEYVLEELALDHWAQTAHHAYEEWIDRIEDGEDMEEISTELAEWDGGPDEVPGQGPFRYDSSDERVMLQNKVDDDEHPDASEINFTGLEYVNMPDNEDRWAALNADEVSGVHTLFTEEAVVDGFPDYIEMILPPANWGLGIAFNHEDDVVGDRRVRQAIAHFIDREIIAEASAGPYAMAPSYPAGITSSGEHWIEDIEDELNAYDDPSEGEALMEEAGYEMDGDTWVDGDGNPVEVDVAVPAGWSDWLAGQEATSDLLRDAGFEVDFRSPDVSTYWGSVWPDSDFAMASQGWAQSPRPWFNYDWQFNSHDALEIMGIPEVIEYEPIYQDGPVEVDVTDLISDLAVTTDEDEERELIHELTAISNQYLPFLPLQEKFEQSFLNVDEWRIDLDEDDPDAEAYHWAQFWYGKNGQMWATDAHQ